MSPGGVERVDRTDRVTEIAQRFEESIVSGELAPGELLPSERELSAQLGVSRSVVREALGRLASLGLVRSVHGSGTRVEPPSGRQVTIGYRRLLRRADFAMEDLAAVRLVLEPAIAAMAATRRTEEHLRRLEEAQRELGDPSRRLSTHIKADLEFHATLADATGNAAFHLVLAPIQELLIESRRRTLGRYGASLAHEHHAAILAAVAAREPEAAAAAMRFHIETNFRHLHELGGD